MFPESREPLAGEKGQKEQVELPSEQLSEIPREESDVRRNS